MTFLNVRMSINKSKRTCTFMINIGFLCKLKSSLTYKVGKASTIETYNAFTRKHATNVNSRDNVKNEMEMFADGSTSLFAHLCRGRQEKSGIDDELTSFLRNKYGWTNAASADTTTYCNVGHRAYCL